MSTSSTPEVTSLIVEQRIYTFHPGKLQAFLAIYEQDGRPVQFEYLNRLLGYYVTETGMLNRIVALWGYASIEERTRQRTALFADPRWIDYLARVRPLMVSQESVLLRPAPFFSDNLAAMLATDKET
jgi:hypothetical protein